MGQPWGDASASAATRMVSLWQIFLERMTATIARMSMRALVGALAASAEVKRTNKAK